MTTYPPPPVTSVRFPQMAHSPRVHLVYLPGLPRGAGPADPTRAAGAAEPGPRPQTRPAGGGPPLGHHRSGLGERQVRQRSGQVSRAPGETGVRSGQVGSHRPGLRERQVRQRSGQVSWGITAQDSESAR